MGHVLGADLVGSPRSATSCPDGRHRVLVGSVVLLLSTNTGPRTGLLIGLAALFGWMTIMGVDLVDVRRRLWGMKGTPAHWRWSTSTSATCGPVAKATNYPRPNRAAGRRCRSSPTHPELEEKVNPENQGKVTTIGELVEADPPRGRVQTHPDDLGGWHLSTVRPAARRRAGGGRRRAGPGRRQEDLHRQRDYKVLEAFDIGGKENDFKVPAHADRSGDRVWHEHRHHVAHHAPRALHRRPGAGGDPAGDAARRQAADAAARPVASPSSAWS